MRKAVLVWDYMRGLSGSLSSSNFLSSIFYILPFKICILSKVSSFFSLWHFPSYGSNLNLCKDLQVQVPTGSLHLYHILPKHILIQHSQTTSFSWFLHFYEWWPFILYYPAVFSIITYCAICDFLPIFKGTPGVWDLQGKECFVLCVYPQKLFSTFLNIVI